MRRCHHDATYQSTLRIMHVRSITGQQRSRYAYECRACGRMTNWCATRYEAQLEAWYECWIKEE